MLLDISNLVKAEHISKCAMCNLPIEKHESYMLAIAYHNKIIVHTECFVDSEELIPEKK